MKSDRQKLIMKLIMSNRVHNQDELQKLLEEWGMAVTQATLSRDVNELELMKYRADDGSLCYRKRIVDSGSTPSNTSDGIVSAEYLGSLAVVKTHPGFASVVASVIDRASLPEVAGTLAGDDTIMLALRPNTDFESLLVSLESIFPGISAKQI